MNMSAAAAAEAREALVPLWEQHPAVTETFRAFCTGVDKMSQADWQRFIAAFEFEGKFGLSEGESSTMFHACSCSDDGCDPSLSLPDFCSCLVQVPHFINITTAFQHCFTPLAGRPPHKHSPPPPRLSRCLEAGQGPCPRCNLSLFAEPRRAVRARGGDGDARGAGASARARCNIVSLS